MSRLLLPGKTPLKRWVDNAAALRASGDPQTDPNFASVVLLMHCDGVNDGSTLTDSTGRHTVTAQGTPVGPLTKIGAPAPYMGSASCLNVRANNNYGAITNNLGDFAFGTADFTIEAAVYGHFAGATNINGIFSTANFTAGVPGLTFYITDQYAGVFVSGGVGIDYWGPCIGDAKWNTIALVRASGVDKVYWNGAALTPGGTGADTTNYTNTTGAGVLKYYATNELSSTANFNGYVDEIRITKGVARYVSNYTPRNTPFPNSA